MPIRLKELIRNKSKVLAYSLVIIFNIRDKDNILARYIIIYYKTIL